jgi:hypothetical protein
MPDYKAPLRDMRFVLSELLDSESHYASLSSEEQLVPDLFDAIINEAAKFCENILAPINRSGDEEGCQWKDGEVQTPAGFKEAYKQFVEGGWTGLSGEVARGGQGLPSSLSVIVNELIGTANWAWGMYPGLSMGAVRCIESHGSDEQKDVYLNKLIEGNWTGTMCLTEAHCGSDLGLLRTKAEANDDGSYRITGTKIFISAGEHDMAENIVHMVIARTVGAPAGTKGISLFIVPKFLPAQDGSVGERNAVSCGSIEHKMGINASATCVMNFDNATGFMVGEENTGLTQMFTMMNAARLGTAMQGLGTCEAAYQGAVAYALERLQMRSLTGPKNPDGPADPIIVHPDVRRMLMTQKAITEGQRACLYWIALLVDKTIQGEESDRKTAESLLELLTPIAKAFCTESGFEVANLGMQVFGGHGYIREHGMEQIVRDARIAMLYEGTTGIQALDLLGRKVFGSGGKLLKVFTRQVHQFCVDNTDESMKEFVDQLDHANKEWGKLTMELGNRSMENPDEAGAASVDYLMLGGYIVLGYMWAQMAKVAQQKLAEGSNDEAFYTAKLQTAQFYFQKIMPRTLTHLAAAYAGADVVMAMDESSFIL